MLSCVLLLGLTTIFMLAAWLCVPEGRFEARLLIQWILFLLGLR